MEKNVREKKPRFSIAGIVACLVVVGLMAGAVLSGGSMKKTAEMRSDLTQVEKYKQAAEEFRGKYGYLPGDIPAALVMQLRFTARDGSQGRGDGNGLVEGFVYSAGHATGTAQTGEPFFFWEDLYSSMMIKEPFDKAFDAEPGKDVLAVGEYLPDAQMGHGNYIYVYSYNKANYYGMSNVKQINGSDGSLISSPGLSAREASDIDKKIDDGNPASGKVLAQYINVSVMDAPSSAGPSATACYDTASSHYVLSGDSGAANCALSFVF